MSTATPGQHTIAAVATPPGHGGIGVVRISGPDVPRLARALLHACPPPRKACVHTFHDGQGAPVDRGLVLYFRRPHSFTGEHVLELHAHGGPAVLDVLLQRALSLGARMAAPGEFSQRAFLNGKLDLAQAEAVADLIAAGSHQAARAAARSLTGEFSRAVAEVAGELVALRVYVEAAIDFPDEEIDFLGDGEIVGRLEQIIARLSPLRADAGRGAALRAGR
ncbi:MAG: tRNA uridine-5-carboxymethylaminomethyl(34) synthesis GTPase MnmE, partial [Salinisphaera sp.]|nr:tRNA uridine-5-carboxymethylaminomethyl(34) synthesis GTPase MnmE [Salinisphaera sp.]